MNESQVRNLTPDELLNAFECGQLTNENIKQAFEVMCDTLRCEKNTSERMLKALEEIHGGASDPYRKAFSALQDLGLTYDIIPHEDDRDDMRTALRFITANAEPFL